MAPVLSGESMEGTWAQLVADFQLTRDLKFRLRPGDD
jgi:hypothetical protein